MKKPVIEICPLSRRQDADVTRTMIKQGPCTCPKPERGAYSVCRRCGREVR